MVTYINMVPVKGFIDHSDMKEAVMKANCNLFTRHGVYISLEPKKMPIGYRIKVSGDEDKVEKFLKSPGRRLKGIPAYLLKTWPEKYRPLRHGKRLFLYVLENR